MLTPGGRPGDASPLGKGKRRLTNYEREVAHALMRSGHSRKNAIQIARGVIDRAAATGRWGKGKAKANVRAGAVASVAQRGSMNLANEPVTMISSQDGPRMSGNLSNFGSKRAMPFGKGGKRAKKGAAAKRAMAQRVRSGHFASSKATQSRESMNFSNELLDLARGNLANFGNKRAAAFGKGGKPAHKPLSKGQRAKMPSSDFVFPKTRKYPIKDKRHAAIAIADSTGTPQNAAVRRAVAKKFGIGKSGK